MSSVTIEAFRIVRRAIRRGSRVGVVTGDATQGPRTPRVTFRLHQPYRLKPSQMRVVRADLAWSSSGWVAVARATQLQECLGGKPSGPNCIDRSGSASPRRAASTCFRLGP